MMVNRVTGEVLPAKEEFTHCELGVMTVKGDKKIFKRNELAHNLSDIQSWRDKHNNIGVFRSMLMSSNPKYLAEYDNDQTLFLAPLTFDMDASEDPSPQAWENLVKEVRLLITYICYMFHIKDEECVRVWFSGGRGFHIEFPIETIGIYPHHDLAKIFSCIGRYLYQEMNLKHMDMSLFGSKHLFRLDHSIHQRTGNYKWPMRVREILKAHDFQFLSSISKTPRSGFDEKFWPTIEANQATMRVWDKLVEEAITVKKKNFDITPSSPLNYDMHSYRCIEMQFEPDYIVPEGTRYNIAYIIAQHFKQNGFDKKYTWDKLTDWATNHCDPPYINESDILELERMLDQVYNGDRNHLGCGYIQRNVPMICEEHKCPIGIRNRRKSISLL